MTRKTYIFCFFLLSTLTVKAQTDSAYVEYMGEKLLVAPFISTRNLILEFRPQNDQGVSIKSNTAEYHPNTRRVTGVMLFYKNIGLSLALKAPDAINNVEKYGKTDYFDLNVHYMKRKIVADFYYKDFKGFADYNTEIYTPNPPENGFALRPDIRMNYGKLKGIYLFNGDKYSYRSAFNFVERQRKSVGSWLLLSHLYHLNLSADSAIIPKPIQPVFEEYGQIEGYQVTGGGLGGGYTYNFVLAKKFTITPLLAFGLDLQHQQFKVSPQESETNRWSAVPLFDLRLSAGYNSEKFFAGLTMTNDLTAVHFPKLVNTSQYIRIDLRVGFRLNPPKVLKKIPNRKAKKS